MRCCKTVSALAAVSLVMGCDSHAHQVQALPYHQLAQDVLITRGICADANACQRRQLLFWTAGEWALGLVHWGGVGITLYETHDMAMVHESEDRFRQLHGQLKRPPVTLMVYQSRHGETDRLLSEISIR
ncbi:MAG: hypothetical protein CFE44_09305 [Burkholderiales bacterium PBB4]|nr:MAG: hypothetical protein CFE44_09305 [Burkholderiales bacterium PBB4]